LVKEKLAGLATPQAELMAVLVPTVPLAVAVALALPSVPMAAGLPLRTA
jgi:hypothetical protein